MNVARGCSKIILWVMQKKLTLKFKECLFYFYPTDFYIIDIHYFSNWKRPLLRFWVPLFAMSQGRVLFNFSNIIFKASHTISPYLKLTMKKRISLCQVLQSVYVYFDESKTTKRNTSNIYFTTLCKKKWLAKTKIKLMRRLKKGCSA